jgi:hypothetical protein
LLPYYFFQYLSLIKTITIFAINIQLNLGLPCFWQLSLFRSYIIQFKRWHSWISKMHFKLIGSHDNSIFAIIWRIKGWIIQMLFVKMTLNFLMVMGYCSIYMNIFQQGFKCNVDDNVSKVFHFKCKHYLFVFHSHLTSTYDQLWCNLH